MILCGLINKDELFFSGKGMGGHAAIYMATEFNAKGCLAHNPTTNLSDSVCEEKTQISFDQIFQAQFQTIIAISNQGIGISAKISITHNLDPSRPFSKNTLLLCLII